MGRISLKAQRRVDLIRACMRTIHEEGFEAASLARIARRAGLTAGIVSHYFRDKAELLEATMRFIARELYDHQLKALRHAQSPMERVLATIDVNLGSAQFNAETTSVWLAFWGRVNHVPQLARIQRVISRRLMSNLCADIRHLVSDQCPDHEKVVQHIALGLSVMIDGLWLRAALTNGGIEPEETRALAVNYLKMEIERVNQQ
jgi:transcriptional repressor BetI